MEESLFKKYIHSVLSPTEFVKFCNYLSDIGNTERISKLVEDKWETTLREQNMDKKNPLLFQKIRLAIIQEQAEKSDKKLKLYSLVLRIAAILVVGLLLSTVWFYYQKDSAFKNIPVQTVQIPNGAKTQFALPDGSSVWLNSGSSLSFSGNFSKMRKVILKGEAYFDVVKNKKTFIVETPYGNVEVLGTAFNIQAYNDHEFITTLERGIVNVTDKQYGQSLTMNPGEQVSLINSKLVKKEVDTNLFTSWKDGKLILERDSFVDIAKKLERWFNVRIEYSPEELDKLWFSGTIEDETITEVLSMICKTAPVVYTYNSNTRVIKIELKK